MGGAYLRESFHGEQIGVTTLTMARLQERVLANRPIVRPTVVDAADLTAHFGAEMGAACARELAAKALSPATADALNERLSRSWPAMRERFAAVRRSAADLQRALAAAGAPTRPADLDWPAPFYRTAVMRARQIRSRYSFLDLAGDAGLLEAFAAQEG
jgi:glycerol-1-phosphate dehydrogenase [NAD(P)+]